MASAAANWGDDGRHYESLRQFVGVAGGGESSPKTRGEEGASPAIWRRQPGAAAELSNEPQSRSGPDCERPFPQTSRSSTSAPEARKAFAAAPALLLAFYVFLRCSFPLARIMHAVLAIFLSAGASFPPFLSAAQKNSRCIKLSRS